MLKRACKKHASWIGCAVAVITFVALHVAVPALVATGVAGHAHAGSTPEAGLVKVLSEKWGGLTIYEYKGCIIATRAREGIAMSCVR